MWRRKTILIAHGRLRLTIWTRPQKYSWKYININAAKINFFRICQQKIAETKNRPSTIVGRIAGQYAKPRSTEFVVVNGKKIHNYKGDNVNNVTEAEREPSQHRLTQGYFNSIATHNYIQSMFPDLFTSHEGLILPYEAALTR